MGDQDPTRSGVGDSGTESGEDVAKRKDEPGRQDAGRQGESERPAGTSTARDSTGVNPKDPIDEDMPEMPPP